MIPVFELAKTVHASDRVAIVTGSYTTILQQLRICVLSTEAINLLYAYVTVTFLSSPLYSPGIENFVQ
jgi:hypothetical protein